LLFSASLLKIADYTTGSGYTIKMAKGVFFFMVDTTNKDENENTDQTDFSDEDALNPSENGKNQKMMN
jgi:hypothetical protein